MKNKIIHFLGALFLFAGFLFAFIPHAFHSKVGFTNESHMSHVTTGIVIALIGLVIITINSKATISLDKTNSNKRQKKSKK